VHHILRKSHERGAKADKKLFNYAADLPINHDLRASGWDTSTTWLFPETYGFKPGLTAEQYYDLLKKNPPPKGGGNKGKEKGKEKEEDNPSPGGEGDSEQPQYQVGEGHCGGCVNNPEKEELEADADKQFGRTEIEQKQILDQTFEDIRGAASNARERGNIPGWMKELADKNLLPPKVPWRRKVASIVRKATGQITSGGSDFSLIRPSKRSLVRGVIRPGLIESMPIVVYIIDTSGSMDTQTQIRSALTETCSCMRAVGVDRAWVIQADMIVQDAKLMKASDIPGMEIKGRGGTSFIEAIDKAVELKPNLIIYMTDGEGTAPRNAPPDTAFIWCLVPSPWSRRPAAWGHVVVVEDGAHPFEKPNDDDVNDDDDEDA
jgi:hypothetical protein